MEEGCWVDGKFLSVPGGEERQQLWRATVVLDEGRKKKFTCCKVLVSR